MDIYLFIVTEHSSGVGDSSSHVGTQADLYHHPAHHHSSGGGGGGSGGGGNANVVGGYVSDDEVVMLRQLRQQQRINTGRISREDFREQYCISERVLEDLNDSKSRSTGFLFGCLSSYQVSHLLISR